MVCGKQLPLAILQMVRGKPADAIVSADLQMDKSNVVGKIQSRIIALESIHS
jgi:hypothetical protein